MKALAIVGTMRKNGDSYRILKRFEESLQGKANAEVEYLFLSDVDLGCCRGCCACFTQGESRCPKRKLTEPIENRLMESDGVVLASPVYAHHVTAVMKNFLDHFAYFFHRPRFFGKPAVHVSSTGGSGLKETLDYLRFTSKGWGYVPAGTIGVAQWRYESDKSYRGKIGAEIERAAANFVKTAASKTPPRPGMHDLMFFRAMRMKAEYIPFDRAYWDERGWFTQSYFTAAPINPFALLAANALEALIRASRQGVRKPDTRS